MLQDTENLELVREAIAGQREALSALAEIAQNRVRSYARRVLLDPEATDEITSDTMVAMLSSLPQLKDPARFWGWLFTIATNRVRQTFRRRNPRPASLNVLHEAGGDPPSREPEGLGRLEREELAERTREAMGDLEVRYRMVLALRFYEDLPHSAISTALGCSEMTARVTFLRAKRALVRALRRRGIQAGAVGPAACGLLGARVTEADVLVAALKAFGDATSGAAQASSISVAAVREGVTGTILTGKMIGAAAAAIVALLAWSFFSDLKPVPHLAQVRGIHFTELALSTASTNLPFPGTCSQGAYEQWFHFPQGVDGPLLYRSQRWDPWRKERLCWWVQSDEANYYVFAGKRVHIQNARSFGGGMRVATLPTDPPEFVDFIRQTERATPAGAKNAAAGSTTRPAIEYTRDPKTGFLATRVDHRFPELGDFESRYEYDRQSPELFTAPAGLRVIDERDEMHRRGWTWFRIHGEINGRKVSGAGCVPLVYAALAGHPPWLHLRVEGDSEIVDTPTGACLTLTRGAAPIQIRYPSGSFLAGLSRPWIGFHSIDLVRRDAAQRRIRFETWMLDALPAAVVRLIDTRRGAAVSASFRVNMERDLIDQVLLVSTGAPAGTLHFDYLNAVTGLDAEFATPALPATIRGQRETAAPGPLWPALLLGAESMGRFDREGI